MLFRSYKTHAKENSLYNTPPVFCVWAYKLVCEWLKENGGLDAAQERAEKKASLVYGAIDASDGYYRCPVSTTCRSRMNLVWRLPTEDLEKKFVSEASAKGMVGLKGHRSVGGIRASIYNAMPIEGVEALVSFMNDFRKANA